MKHRPPGASVRVMHLITGTNVGGAEMMLYGLLSRMDRSRFSNIVYSMLSPGPAADKIADLGIEVRTLGMKQGRPDLRAIFRLTTAVREWKPHAIQTWMYHANLLGGVVGKVIAGVPVVWGIHHTSLDRSSSQPMTISVSRACALLSRAIPDRIICCAQSSRRVHAAFGYADSRMTVIPNGFSLPRAQPKRDIRGECSRKFGIPVNGDVISLVARYHPQKDHATFISAAALCSRCFPESNFALCGDGITQENEALVSLIRRAGLDDRMFLLGRLEPDDIALIMSRSTALTTSSAWGEAFPMVVGEAMACGTVCVVTDVGDSAYMVGDTGIVVPPRSPEALADGWAQVLSMDSGQREALGRAARSRIEANFDLDKIASRYEEIYLELAGDLKTRNSAWSANGGDSLRSADPNPVSRSKF